MATTFQINQGGRNFQLLYDTIKEFYPVEEPDKYTFNTLDLFPGTAKCAKIFDENLGTRKKYREWRQFDKHVEKKLKKRVRSTFTAFNCAYSAEVLLEEHNEADFQRSKKIHYRISVLGPYFSIIGIDSSVSLLKDDYREPIILTFPTDHAVTVSPHFEYQNDFIAVEQMIKEHFPGYRFIPFVIGMTTIDGIVPSDVEPAEPLADTVFAALFGPMGNPTCKKRGDEFYGYDDWPKLSDDSYRVAILLADHINQPQSGTSVNKVWKLTNQTRMSSYEKSALMSFAADAISVLDLTDPTTAIIKLTTERAPIEISYSIEDDAIKLNHDHSFKLKIATLTENSLSVIVHVNVQENNDFIRGDIAQWTYEQMKA